MTPRIVPEYVCPFCRLALNKITKFCGHCGGKLPADLKPIGHVCQACGNEIDMGLRLGGPKFCENCGVELNRSAE